MRNAAKRDWLMQAVQGEDMVPTKPERKNEPTGLRECSETARSVNGGLYVSLDAWDWRADRSSQAI